MNISRTEIQRQFERALRLGWLPFFIEAAKTHTAGYFDEADLLGIASRETNLDPKWLTKPGDNGNGFGLMQADRRSFPEFTKGDGWKDARTGILFGARVLMQKLADTRKCRGVKAVVKSSKGGIYSFVGKMVSGSELRTVSVSAYNCGRWAHYAVSTGRNADRYSTGRDYAADVEERAREFRVLFGKWSEQNAPVPAPAPSLDPPAGLTPTAEPSPVVLTPTSDEASAAEAENAKLKEFSEKYLKHCKNDSVKNILGVVGVRILSSVSSVWAFGLSGRIALVLTLAAVAGFILYALVYYRRRIFGWTKTLFESLFNS